MAKAMEAIEIDIEDLREEFRRLRRVRKLSQKEAGDLVGLSQAFVSAFEKGTYSKSRTHSLNQVWNLVQFWRREASGIGDAGFPSHGVIVAPVQRQGGFPAPTGCPNCAKAVASEDPPAQYCSGCGEALGTRCACGHPIQDRHANFCSCCARDLRPDASSIRPYPKYLDPDEVRRIKYVRGFLKATDQEIESVSGSKSESENQD